MKIFNKIISTSPFFYIIRHKKTNKFYAGAKWSNHKAPCDSNLFMTSFGYKTTSKIVKSMIEFDGLDSFEVLRIRHFNDPDSVIDFESRFLTKVDAMRNPSFLNKSNGGKSFRCLKHTEETLRKLKGRKCSEETKLKMREACKRRPPTSEKTREKISNAAKGRKMSEETKQKLSAASKFRKSISEETRIKMSISSKGRKLSQKQKDHLREVNTGRKMSEETKLKISKIHSGSKWWNNGIERKFCKNSPGIEWKKGTKLHFRLP